MNFAAAKAAIPVLIVEDNRDEQAKYASWFDEIAKYNKSLFNYEVQFAPKFSRTVEDALAKVRQMAVALTILDWDLGKRKGNDFLKAIRQEGMFTRAGRIVVISGELTDPWGVRGQQMMHLGAHDVVIRSAGAFETLREIVENVFDLPGRFDLDEFENTPIDGLRDWLCQAFIGSSLFASRIRHQICGAALNSKTAVLITGPSGSGKEVVARSIHQLSQAGRDGRRMRALNCAAIQKSLLQAELFGAARGAATGVSEREGYLKAAEGTTLFLDEIGHSDIEFQTALLRAIETNRANPVGSVEEYEIKDVRYIAATDQATENLTPAFFHRLAGVHLQLLPLDDESRIGDKKVLLESFAGPTLAKFTPGAVNRLIAARWPGNVREFLHSIEILKAEAERKERITEARVSRLLSERASNAAAEPREPRRRYDDLFEEELDFRQIAERLEKEVFEKVHIEETAGARTTSAYQAVARRLGCGVTKVKDVLRRQR